MRRAVAGILIGVGAAALVLGIDLIFRSVGGGTTQTPLDTIELKTYDWRLARTARPDTARQDLALVEIDEYSLRNLQPNAGRWPWPRVVHSMLIDYLVRGKAKLIVYDVDFAEADSRVGFEMGGETWSGAQSDRALVDSVRQAGNVILLADATFTGEASEPPALPDYGYRLNAPGITERQAIFPPFADLAAAGAALGHNLFVFDPDGPIRHTVPFVRSHGRALASLGVTAALRASNIAPGDITVERDRLRLRDRVMPLMWRKVAVAGGAESYLWGLINFRGPALLEDLKSHTYADYSFFDLLYSEEQIQADVKPNIDPSVFRDKIVFVGVSGSGLGDTFETPFSHGKMPGIQVHAAVADDILSNRFMTPAAPAVRLATVVAGALAIGIVATIVPAWWATAIAVVVFALSGWTATRLFAAGYWMNVTQPVLASSIALFGGVGYQYFVEGREKRKMKRLFGQYVSKDVYEQLVANPSLARLGGQRRDMTVLFSDIRGFTTVSERGEPEEIVHMLNQYFTRMVDIVFRHKGTLDKFVGDMVMALFGAPLDDPDHAQHAVEAALEMIDDLQKLNRKWAEEGRPSLDIGIGINTGPMIAGNIGSEAIMSYTVIGDAVNLGSRLESLNKQYGTRIIISDATRDRIGPGYDLRPLGDVVVKGKTKPVAIFELMGRVMKQAVMVAALLAVAAPAWAQFGGLGKVLDKAQKVEDRKKQLDDLNITEEEEQQIGQQVSEKIRQRFGVVQDANVHRYVGLVGTALAQQTDRPKLPWQFIVLDTDGVNAFASPGGYVHITRGALALIKNEAELAGVLAHEIGHVTRKHTINAIRKNKAVQLGTSETLSNRGMFLDKIADKTYEIVLENSFDRGDELDADKVSVELTQKVGYAPAALADFLVTLDDRNKDQPQKNGLFASHPETKERIEKVRQLAAGKTGATVEARYHENIKFQPTDITKIAVITEGSAGLAGGGKEDKSDKDAKDEKKDDQPKKKGFGLGGLKQTVAPERQSAQVSASGGARGVGPDRAAKGGGNPNTVKVAISAADVAAFRKGIAG